MKNTQKTTHVIIGIMAMLVIVGVWAFNQDSKSGSTEGANQTLHIGGILPMTGDLAFVGEAMQRGVAVAVSELQSKGVDIQVDIQDDALLAKNTASIAQRYIAEDMDGVFVAAVQQSKPISELFKKVNKPLLVAWDSTEYIESLGRPIYSSGFSIEKTGRFVAQSLPSTSKKLAAIYQKDEWSQLITESAVAEFKNRGEVVFFEGMTLDQKDFKAIVAKIIDSNADTVYMPLLPNSNAPFVKQLRDQGFKGLIVAGDTIAPSEIADMGEYATGFMYANVFPNDTVGFAEKYKQHHGSDSVDIVFEGFGYDAVMTYYEAYKIATEKGISIADAMAQVKFVGANGDIDFTKTNVSEKIEKMYRVEKGGEIVEVK
jgi:branched-chain amino acid transport system substrate-binding protein